MKYLLLCPLLLSSLWADSAATANVGQRVVISVTANGTNTPATPFSYQWSLNGVPVVGATDASYALFPVKATDAGVYTVQVTNSAGNALSDQSVLLVTVPPANVKTSIVVATILIGDTNPTFIWRRDGNIIGGATHSVLTNMDVRTHTYTCTINYPRKPLLP